MSTWLERINVLELSAVKRPANRKSKVFQKAEWSRAYINDLPDSAFLYVEPGGERDGEGRTTPRSLRHFPVRDVDGKVDAPHVRNALARIPQSKISAAAKAAALAKARRLLEQITKSMEDDMNPDEALTEFVAKAKMSPEQKEAIKMALGALRKAKKEMPEEMFKGTAAQLMKLLGLEPAGKSEDELRQAADGATAKAVEVVKSALEKLEQDNPAINDAVAQLAELAGVTPTFKRLEQLPPELKAEWEAMIKSREDDRQKLEELHKAIAQREEDVAAKEFVAKAQAMTVAPVTADALGHLMHLVAKTEDKAAVDCLDAILKSAAELAKQSALFQELGGGGNIPQDRSGVFGRVEAMAEQLLQKSERPLTKEQAIASVFAQNPKLYDEYCRQA